MKKFKFNIFTLFSILAFCYFVYLATNHVPAETASETTMIITMIQLNTTLLSFFIFVGFDIIYSKISNIEKK